MDSKRPASSEEEQSRKRLAAEQETDSDQEMRKRIEGVTLSSTSPEKTSTSRSGSKTSSSRTATASTSTASASSKSGTSMSSWSANPSTTSSSSSGKRGNLGLDILDIDFLERNNYRITKLLGSGSFGYVYQATSVQYNEVAIKVLKEGHQFTSMNTIDRCIETTDRIIQLRHPNIVTNYAHLLNFERFHRLYIITAFTELPDLYHATQIRNPLGYKIWWPLDEYQARHLIRGIARGVAYMHENFMSHSDLKLDNVLLFWSNNATPQQKQISMSDILTRDKHVIYEIIPKLTDFDKCMIRKVTDPRGTIMTINPRSHVSYAAPESYRGIEYDLIKGDCYSVGCCLMALLLASHPFGHPLGIVQPTHAVTNLCNKLKMDVSYIRELIKHLSPELRRVLEKLLDPNSDSRISLNQFLADPWFSKTEQLYKHRRYTSYGKTYAADV